MAIKIIENPIKKAELIQIASEQFGDFVKAVVDIDKKIMAIGGEMHADEEALLITQGSKQEKLWGVNLYPERHDEEFIEFNSMINLRPSQGNRSRGVESEEIRNQIRAVIKKLIIE